VETADDVAAYLLAGADVVMTTSSLLRHGPTHAAVLLDGLRAWMERKGFTDITEFRGMLAHADTAQLGFGRSGYLSAVEQASRAFSPR
jgi:dihydroorotate dehydrogenase (fumarate)